MTSRRVTLRNPAIPRPYRDELFSGLCKRQIDFQTPADKTGTINCTSLTNNKNKGKPMKKTFLGLLALACSVSASGEAADMYIYGKVGCDILKECHYTIAGGIAFPGVTININDSSGNFVTSGTTDAEGKYVILVSDPGTYTAVIDQSTLQAGAVVISPASGEYTVYLGLGDKERRDFVVDDVLCGDTGACWMTAGGVKFEAIMGTDAAQSGSNGPKDSFGGNVNPSCSSEPGDGGNWNHVAHSVKLHLKGTDIQVVRCGNVVGIDPGSESPVTPFNFIEFDGTGTISGIKGNKFPTTDVEFFARVEDHNEPGNDNAADGEDVDTYFLHVTDAATGETLLLVDVDGNASTVDPVTITGGNLQLHFSSCD